MATRYRITAAPSKMALMLHVFDRRQHPTITFSVIDEANPRIRVPDFVGGVTELAPEDGSNESWCLKCYVSGRKDVHNIKCWFRTDGRRGGWLEVID